MASSSKVKASRYTKGKPSTTRNFRRTKGEPSSLAALQREKLKKKERQALRSSIPKSQEGSFHLHDLRHKISEVAIVGV